MNSYNMKKKYKSPKTRVCSIEDDFLLTQMSGGDNGTPGDIAESKRMNQMPIDDWDSEEEL